ncbi:MAG: DUF4281 domain-containing protein [Tabrizicola sp.]|nr:DUF4281 domain-containing protein [Tabrizicola sp.]
MTPETLFQIANPLAMLGWLALLASPLAPRVLMPLASVVLPLLLALAYSGLVLAHLAGAEGGFSSLAEVQRLFTQPEIALAGWLHYLAFDLFVGAWATRTAHDEGIPHLFLIPCLVLTFLFGPAGFLAFWLLRTSRMVKKKASA